MSGLFATCSGLIFVGHGLSYACLGRFLTDCWYLVHYTTLGALCHDNLACLGQLIKIGNSLAG